MKVFFFTKEGDRDIPTLRAGKAREREDGGQWFMQEERALNEPNQST